MDFYSLIFLSCAIGMDVFAVSLCKGFSTSKLELKHYMITGIYFSIFQALMPIIGYIAAKAFISFIQSIDHWIAFVLLSLVGFKMIKESFKNQACDPNSNQFGFKIMFVLAIATSIDAFAVGISFAFLHVNLFLALFLIAFITFILSVLALKIGNQFGIYLKNKAELLGGCVLIILGFKILIQHLFFAPNF